MSDPTFDPSTFASQVQADAYRVVRFWVWVRTIVAGAVVLGSVALFLAAVWSIAEWMLR